MSDFVSIDVEVTTETEVEVTEVTCSCGKDIEFSANSEGGCAISIGIEPHECSELEFPRTVKCASCGAKVNYAINLSSAGLSVSVDYHTCPKKEISK